MMWGTNWQSVWALLVVFLAFICYGPLQTFKGNYSPKDIQERYGEWAIVAGASEGLGASWAELLCENGLNVVLLARRQHVMNHLAEQLIQKHGCQVETFVLDLNDEETIVRHSFQNILEQRDNFGLLIYNAAFTNEGKFLKRPLEDQYKTFNINIRSVVTLSHVFGSYRQQQQQQQQEVQSTIKKVFGGMILMSSLTGVTGSSSIANYAATKAWNTQFAHGLYREWKALGLDVLACVAGATLTPTFERTYERTVSGTTVTAEMMHRYVQLPRDVTRECLQALGKIPSVATGPKNKFARFLLSRLLTPSLGLAIMGTELDKTLQE